MPLAVRDRCAFQENRSLGVSDGGVLPLRRELWSSALVLAAVSWDRERREVGAVRCAPLPVPPARHASSAAGWQRVQPVLPVGRAGQDGDVEGHPVWRMHEDGDRGGRSSLRGVGRLDQALARIRLAEKYPQVEIVAVPKRHWTLAPW